MFTYLCEWKGVSSCNWPGWNVSCSTDRYVGNHDEHQLRKRTLARREKKKVGSHICTQSRYLFNFPRNNEKPRYDWNYFEAIIQRIFFQSAFFFLRHSCYLLDRPSEEVATVAVVVVTCSYLMGWPQPTWPFRSGRQVIWKNKLFFFF